MGFLQEIMFHLAQWHELRILLNVNNKYIIGDSWGIDSSVAINPFQRFDLTRLSQELIAYNSHRVKKYVNL